MPRLCHACTHPDRAAIDAALGSGTPLRAVAERFGLSRSGAHLHLRNHLHPMLAAAAKATTPTEAVREPVQRAKAILEGSAPTASDILALTGLLERLVKNLDRLDGAADAAADGQPAALAALSGQITRAIEAAGKLQGFYAAGEAAAGPRFSVTINMPKIPDQAAPAIDVAPTPHAPTPESITFRLAGQN